jgi:hypothetical protein
MSPRNPRARANPVLAQDELKVLARNGVVFCDGLRPAYIQEPWLAEDAGFSLAMDAQPGLITTSNAGIPAWMANLLDPEIVRVVTQPMRAAEIFGERKKGDWTTLTTQFPVVEPTGQVTSYGDYNAGGNASANANWPSRQSYHYQAVSRWGEREIAIYGEARIQYKQEVDLASALVLNKYGNLAYFYGVSNLALYGALNDPSLPAPITPAAAWSTYTDAVQYYNDIKKLFAQLQTQLTGWLRLDAKMTLTMSPALEVYLTSTNDYNVNVADLLRKNFPNLKIETAPEYGNANNAGELMQLILDELDGIETAYVAFTEKMRAHPVVQGLSSFEQKKSAGTWGYINRRPVALAQMQGM